MNTLLHTIEAHAKGELASAFLYSRSIASGFGLEVVEVSMFDSRGFVGGHSQPCRATSVIPALGTVESSALSLGKTLGFGTNPQGDR